MRNPFTLIQNKLSSMPEEKSKIDKQIKKDEGSKKETARNSSGGGKSKVTAKHVSNDDNNKTYDLNYCEIISMANKKKKNRKRNKIARYSRKINRKNR